MYSIRRPNEVRPYSKRSYTANAVKLSVRDERQRGT
nr:MAG TPA: hypothetical protein [Caudoviricetes sp.]